MSEVCRRVVSLQNPESNDRALLDQVREGIAKGDSAVIEMVLRRPEEFLRRFGYEDYPDLKSNALAGISIKQRSRARVILGQLTHLRRFANFQLNQSNRIPSDDIEAVNERVQFELLNQAVSVPIHREQTIQELTEKKGRLETNGIEVPILARMLMVHHLGQVEAKQFNWDHWESDLALVRSLRSPTSTNSSFASSNVGNSVDAIFIEMKFRLLELARRQQGDRDTIQRMLSSLARS